MAEAGGCPGRCSGRMVAWSRTRGALCVTTSGTFPWLRLPSCAASWRWARLCGSPTRAHFGAGSGKIALDNMQCGQESHLGQCVHGGRLGTTAGTWRMPVLSAQVSGCCQSLPGGLLLWSPTQPYTHTHTHPSGTHPTAQSQNVMDQAGSLAPSQVRPSHPTTP